jgi:hypothetical protein
MHNNYVFPVLVYGFVSDIVFKDDKQFNVFVDGPSGRPIYATLVITDFHLTKALEKYHEYMKINHSAMRTLDKWATQKGKKYNRKYTCKWQIAFCGLNCQTFLFEEEVLSNDKDQDKDKDDELS